MGKRHRPSRAVREGDHPHRSVAARTGGGDDFRRARCGFFGIGLEDISVRHGDTAEVQYGIATFGSRNMALGGTAILRTMERVLEKMK